MRNHTLLRPILVLGFSCVLGIATTEAGATSVTFQASLEYAGGTPPVGSAPWLTATFDDGNSSGLVTMTLVATNLTGNEFVSVWDFNLDPNLEPTDLIFSAPAKVGSFADPKISLGENEFKADGDGHFDILVGFVTSDGLPDRFSAGDSVSYTITGIQDLTANSFNFMSAPDGAGTGLYPTAAHVQATGGGGDSTSGWVSVPEPVSLSLLGMGGLVAMLRRRR